MSWPVGMGGLFEGILDLTTGKVSRPEGDSRAFLGKVDDAPTLPADITEEVELAQAGYAQFDGEAYRNGDLTPVYFGSALKDFGVAELIDALSRHAPPRARSLPSLRPSRRRTRKSPASYSRCRRTWTRSTATGSHSCGCARARSSAA